MSKRCFYSDWDALVSKEMTAQINSIVFVKNSESSMSEVMTRSQYRFFIVRSDGRMEWRKRVNALNSKQILVVLNCCWCSWICRHSVIRRRRSRRMTLTTSRWSHLEDDVVETFRRSVMWLDLLTLDRSDVQYPAKETTHDIVKSLVRHQRPRHCVRFWIYVLTLVWRC